MFFHIVKVFICGSAVIAIFAWAVIHAIRVHDAEDTKRSQALVKRMREKGERW